MTLTEIGMQRMQERERRRAILDKQPVDVTEEEFAFVLEAFDWYYSYSDDHRVWSSGNWMYNMIQSILNAHPQYQGVWDRMQPYTKS